MDPGTGEFHNLADSEVRNKLAEKFGVQAADLEKQIRKIGWMELNVGEIVKLKGHDFEVKSIEDSLVTLQNVKFVDRSLKQ